MSWAFQPLLPGAAQQLAGGGGPSWTVIGINFRATAGYVTDGTDETYCLGQDDPYPVTRGGATFGWVIAYSDMKRDRNSALDRRLAGQNQNLNNGTQSEFQLDLDPAYTYTVRVALGDASSNQGYTYAQVKDGSNVRFTVDSGTDLLAPQWFDATGVIRNDTTWPSSNVSQTGLSFASGALTLILGSPSAQDDSSCIAHLYVEREVGATPTVSHFALLGVG